MSASDLISVENSLSDSEGLRGSVSEVLPDPSSADESSPEQAVAAEGPLEGSLEYVPFPRSELELNVVARFEKVVSLLPNHIALRGNGRQWTYEELWLLTDRAAREIKRSTNSGTGCVSYIVDHSPEMVIAALAILKAGKAFLCIHPSLPGVAKAEILLDAGPELLIFTGKHADEARFLSEQIPGLSIQPFESGMTVGGSAHDGDGLGHSVDELPQERGSLLAPAFEGAERTVELDASSPASVCYTSGSTGKPRGIVKSHRAILHRAYISSIHDRIRPTDKLSLLTYTSFASSESDLFGALLNGATIELFDIVEKGLTQFGKWIDDNQITVLHPPVVLFRRYLSTLSGDNNHPSVRLVALAGESVLPNDIERWRQTFAKNCQVGHRFSSTEAGNIAVAYLDASGTKLEDSQPIPVSDKFLSIVDENKQELPPGSQGELVVRSRFLSSGYWRRPEETERKFVASDVPGQRCFYTGDVGCLSADGEFTFLGRKDGQVKIRGYRVEVREIENALLEVGDVSEVAVVAKSSQDEQILVAFVVVKPGSEFDSREIRRHLDAKLPPWKVPAAFHSLDSLPLTLTGKPDRQKLLALYQALPVVTAETDCDSDTTIRRLMNIWQTFFPHTQVRPGDNFLALGGHSIMSLTLVARVTEKFNVTLPLNAAYLYSTVAEMAAAIDSLIGCSTAPASQTLRQVTPNTSFYPPLYIIPGGRGLGIEEIASGAFIENLKDEITAYVLTVRSADGKTTGHEHVADIAAEFLQEIRKVQPQGPYLILGGCIGGAVAYELCRQLEATGETAYLAMIEGNYITSTRWMREASQRFLGSRYVREFPRRISRRLLRVLKRASRAPWNSRGRMLAGSFKRIADEVSATFYIRSEGFFITPQERFHLQYRRAISRYRPGTFSGSAKLLLSSQYAKRPFVKDWQKVMLGRLDVEVFASSHAEILTSSAEESAKFVKRFYREAVTNHPGV